MWPIYKHCALFVDRRSTYTDTSSSSRLTSSSESPPSAFLRYYFCYIANEILDASLLHIARSAQFTMNSSRQRQHRLHELIVVDLDPSIPITVQFGKRLANLLDHDAGPDEPVEGDAWSGSVTCGHPAGFNILPSSVKVQAIKEEKDGGTALCWEV